MGADSLLRRARGEGIRALWGPDFPEMGAGFSRWDQVFQRAWVLATPIMFLKMHLMNCSHFFETSVGAKLAESAGTPWSCRMKRLPGAELEFPRWLHEPAVICVLHVAPSLTSRPAGGSVIPLQMDQAHCC